MVCHNVVENVSSNIYEKKVTLIYCCIYYAWISSSQANAELERFRQ